MNRRGKREREARNRHKRVIVHTRIGAEWATLKLGRKKLGSWYRRDFLVADSRKPVGKRRMSAQRSAAGAIPARPTEQIKRG